MGLSPLQRQVLSSPAATLTPLNGRDTASSCISQKGQCQLDTCNVGLTSKLDRLDSLVSRMVHSLLVVFTGYPALRSSSSLSHSTSNTAPQFTIPPSLQAFASLLLSARRQNSRTNSKSSSKEHSHCKVPMVACKCPSSHSMRFYVRCSHSIKIKNLDATAAISTT